MSKTFKSVNADAKEDLLVVLGVDEGVNIHTESPVDRRGVSIAPSDAPALALAILEASGHTDSSKGGIIDKVSNAMFLLKEHVKAEERNTLEAKEKAELKAEALKLYNAWREANDCEALSSFSDGAPIGAMAEWLAVARKARELGGRAEK